MTRWLPLGLALAIVAPSSADDLGVLRELVDADDRPFERLEASGVSYFADLGPGARGLLINTSTEDDETHEFLGNRLWFATPNEEPTLLVDRYDAGMKAEGLALGAGQLFIVYDNDQDDTSIPSRLRVIPVDVVLQGLQRAE